jgi:hypothetical protein
MEQQSLVWSLPPQNLSACHATIQGLKDYQSRFWAIGLNGDTLQPDGFLKFFEDRSLPFAYFVRSQGVSAGNESAYDANINTLQSYINQQVTAETNLVNAIVTQLKDYQSRNWAIGLNGDTLQPDGFVEFFGQRQLPFDYYVRSQGLSLGEPTAYNNNIQTLQKYLQAVK